MEMLVVAEGSHTCRATRPDSPVGMPPEAHLGKDKLPDGFVPARPNQPDTLANLLEGRDQLRERRMLRLNRLTSL